MVEDIHEVIIVPTVCLSQLKKNKTKLKRIMNRKDSLKNKGK